MTAPAIPLNFRATADSHSGRTGLGITLAWQLRTSNARVRVNTVTRAGDGYAQFNCSEPHALHVGDTVRVVGVTGYVGTAVVRFIVDTSTLVLNMLYSSASGSGYLYADNAQVFIEIQRSLNGSDWDTICTVGMEVEPNELPSEKRDDLVTPDVLLYYRARALNYDLEPSAWTATRTAILPALPDPLPTVTLAASRQSSTTIRLSWDGGTEARCWEIERRPPAGAWIRVYYSASPEVRSEYLDTVLTLQAYEYRIRQRIVHLNGVVLNGAAWQNSDDPFDLNQDGSVDWRDYRLLQSYRGFAATGNVGNWPDFGPSACLPEGNERPDNDPLLDLPPSDATYAPSGAYLDINGDGRVDPTDELLMARRFSFHEPTPPRSDWSDVATTNADANGWFLVYSDFRQHIQRIWLDGENPEALPTSDPHGYARRVHRLAVDQQRGVVYALGGSVADNLSNLFSVPIGGGTPTLLKNTGAHWALAVDDRMGYVYYGSKTAIRRMDLDGGNDTELFAGAAVNLYAMAVDTQRQLLYFSDFDQREIRVYNIITGTVTNLFSYTGGQPAGLAFRQSSDELFIATAVQGGTVESVLPHVAGSVPRVLYRDPQGPREVAIIEDGNDHADKLYWLSGVRVQQGSRDATAAVTTVSGDRACDAPALFALASFVWGTQPAAALQRLRSWGLSNGTIQLAWAVDNIPTEHAEVLLQRSTQPGCGWETLDTVGSLNGFYMDATVTRGQTYYYRLRSQISAADPQPSYWAFTSAAASPEFGPYGAAAIYYNQFQSKEIWRINFDSSDDYRVIRLPNDDNWEIFEIAAAAAATHGVIFFTWSNGTEHRIRAVYLETGLVGDIVLATGGVPEDVVVDPAQEKLYYKTGEYLYVADFSGNNLRQVARGLPNSPTDTERLGLDVANNRMFVSRAVTSASASAYVIVDLVTGELSDSEIDSLTADGAAAAGIAYDGSGYLVYFTGDRSSVAVELVDGVISGTTFSSLSASVGVDIAVSSDFAEVAIVATSHADFPLVGLGYDGLSGTVIKASSRESITSVSTLYYVSPETTTTTTTTEEPTTTTTTTEEPTTTTTTTTLAPVSECRYVYGADITEGRLYSYDVDGLTEEVETDVIDDLFAIDVRPRDVSGWIYFGTNAGIDSLVGRVHAVTGEVQTLVAGLSAGVWAVEAHEQTGWVYYISGWEIRRQRLDGPTNELLHTTTYELHGMALDPCLRRVYWSNAAGIGWLSLDDPETVVSEYDFVPGGDIWGLACDADAGWLFFADLAYSRIYRADAAGVAEIITTDLYFTTPVWLTLDRESQLILYRKSDTTIRSVSYETGSLATTVVTSLDRTLRGLSRCYEPLVCDPTTTTTTEEPTTTTTTEEPTTTTTTEEPTTTTTPEPATTTTTLAPFGDCQHIWWLDSGTQTLRRADFSGGDNTAVVSPISANVGGLLLDLDNNRVLWVDTDLGAIRSAELNGSNPLDLVAGLGQPFGVALDAANNKVYWTEYGSNAGVYVANYPTGTDVTKLDIIPPLFGEPLSLGISTSEAWLFIAYRGLDGNDFLLRTNLDGSVPTVLQSHLPGLLGLSVDDVGGRIFYGHNGDTVSVIGMDGAGNTDIYVADVPTLFWVHYEVATDKVWWSDQGLSAFRRMDADGSNAELMVALDLPQVPGVFLVCGDSGTWDTTTTTTTEEPTTTTTTTTEPETTTTSTTICSTGYCAYLTVGDNNGQRILGYDRDGLPLGELTSTASPFRGLAADLTSNSLYWLADNSLWQGDLAGADPALLHTFSGVSRLQGLSRDPVNGYVYLVDYLAGTLWRVSDLGVAITLQTGLVRPYATAVDESTGTVYWSERGRLRYRTLAGGTGELTVPGLTLPFGIAIDQPTRRLFFVDASTDQLRFVRLLDGGGHVLESGLTYPLAVAVDPAGYVFWSDAGGHVYRCDFDGSHVVTVVSDTGLSPLSLAICPCSADVGEPGTTTTTTTEEPTTTTTTTEEPTTTTTTTEEPTTTTTTAEPETFGPDEIGVVGSRQQIAVDQHQGGDAYPFIDPSDNLEQLIADLYLRYDDSNCGLVQPFRIVWLSGFGTDSVENPSHWVHAYDLLIVDDLGETVFDSRLADDYRVYEWSSTLRAIEWRNGRQLLRILLFKSWESAEDVITWATYLEPENAVLDPRSTETNTPAVLGLIFESGDEAGHNESAQTISHTLPVFLGGYNLAFIAGDTEEISGGRRTTEVLVDVVSGAGVGRFPGCAATPYLTQLNGATADSRGNVILNAEQCYWVSIPRLSGNLLEANTLQVGNDCQPCYDCDDYLNVYRGLQRVSQYYRQLARESEAVRDQMRLNKQRWEDNRACRAGRSLQIAMQPIVPNRLGVTAGICNNTDEPLLNAKLTVDFSGSSISGCVTCNSSIRRGNSDPKSKLGTSTWQPYKLGGGWPVFTAEFDCINPGENGQIAFQLKFEDGSEAANIEATVSCENCGDLPPRSASTGLKSTADDDCCETGGTA